MVLRCNLKKPPIIVVMITTYDALPCVVMPLAE